MVDKATNRQVSEIYLNNRVRAYSAPNDRMADKINEVPLGTSILVSNISKLMVFW